MTSHVDTLHEILGNTPKDELHADQRRALARAIDTCEQHAALVARLGELERVWRLDASSSFPDEDNRENVEAMDRQLINCADDLARVVKGVGDGR